ncbi:MAG: hydantoinase/carbamoylase family amidase, partial [Symbiobacteriaceae bacterium]|nr:hydantoinase/carbamoylase family amidase [Symbiobacteriaceae bacterium]
MELATVLSATRLHINSERLWQRLQEMGKVGWQEGGLYCMAYSEAENQAYHLLAEYMQEAGLAVHRDGAGNIIGRREGMTLGPVVISGSHLDSVYGGGIFDGRLGVLGALEAVQTISELGMTTHYPLEVRAYRNEEGCRFNPTASGAGMITGKTNPKVAASVDRDGITFAQALAQCGIDLAKVQEAVLPPHYVQAHLELHIEQGAVLEGLGLPVGIVTGITTSMRGEFIVRGRSGHAGATPMSLRYDALTAAAEVILCIEQLAGEADACVATVGRIA